MATSSKRSREKVKEIAHKGPDILAKCDICPRKCGVNRLEGETGFCRIGRKAQVASYGPHHGEERPLVGTGGSGTVFFSGCNLSCQFCQNWDISQKARGREMDSTGMAKIFMDLQDRGCHNINLVSPSHVVVQIAEALDEALDMGLSLPIVYNTGGYDSLETLRSLDGIVDIYMPDMKYSDPSVGSGLSRVEDYPEINRNAVKEMHRQVGDLKLDRRGIATSGLIVRHLILPSGLGGTSKIARFLAEEVSTDTYINVMGQYRPEYMAMECPGMDRRITEDEYRSAVEEVLRSGLHRLDTP